MTRGPFEFGTIRIAEYNRRYVGVWMFLGYPTGFHEIACVDRRITNRGEIVLLDPQEWTE